MVQVSHDPLQGVRMKIERAKTHLNELEGKCNAFLDREPYRIVRDKNSDAFKVRVRECVPAELSMAIGDTVHNLRSALDLLAVALVEANGNPSKNTYFPFNASATEFKTKTLRGRMGGASEKALRFVEGLEPYPGGNETLWKIHQLDILDKHKAIIPVGAANTGVDPDVGAIAAASLPEGFERFQESFRAMRISFRPADRHYPLEDGAVLLKGVSANLGHPQPQPKFTIQIAFGEGQIVDGEPLIPTLQQFIQLVEGITETAQQHFFP